MTPNDKQAVPEMDMVEVVARAILGKVPYGYGMTEAEAREYARAAYDVLVEPLSEAIWETMLAALSPADDTLGREGK